MERGTFGHLIPLLSVARRYREFGLHVEPVEGYGDEWTNATMVDVWDDKRTTNLRLDLDWNGRGKVNRVYDYEGMRWIPTRKAITQIQSMVQAAQRKAVAR